MSRAGTLRGVHFADVPPGQAKYVTCPRGAVLDFMVDVRVGSPTFGVVDVVRLDSEHRRAVYLPEGVGHAFLALEDDSTLTYLCSTGYAPGREHGINPLDPDLGLAAAGRRRLPAVRQGRRGADAGARRPAVRPAADLGRLPGVRRQPDLTCSAADRSDRRNEPAHGATQHQRGGAT